MLKQDAAVNMVKIGIIQEGKIPHDARVPLSPDQCVELQARFQCSVVVAPSPMRCFQDREYAEKGIVLQEDLRDCDILLGVKEVPVDQLIPEKTYLFFSHTIKKQAYNRRLLQAVLERHIRLIDYEVITDEHGDRLIAFGFYAGIVGAHNGVWTYGQKTGLFSLPRMVHCHDYAEVKAQYRNIQWPPMRIVLTGGGRVASGAVRNLHDMGFHAVSPYDFLHKKYDVPVFTQLFAQDYVQHREGRRIFDKQHFYRHGEEYISVFAPFAAKADIFLNGIYYDPKAPAFFSLTDMKSSDFNIQVIGDITCDIAPASSVPSTIRPSTIAEPVYGFDPVGAQEVAAFRPGCIDVMAIDNLPSELPRDASVFFGRQLIDNVVAELLKGPNSPILQRATIAAEGQLTPAFAFLSDFVSADDPIHA